MNNQVFYKHKNQKRGRRSSNLLLPLFFLIIFFYFPVISALIPGFIEEDHFSLQIFKELFTSSYFLRILSFTFFQALLSTIFSILVGLPGAWIIARYNFKGKRFLKALITLPFVLPSILVVLGFVLFFGNNGIINRILMAFLKLETPPLRILYSFKAIILAHIFYNFPICIRFVSSRWETIPQNLIEAAQNLGSKKIKIFKDVWLPYALPSIFSAAALIFLYCFLSFAIILVLGGGPEFSTLEVEIYRLSRISLDFSKSGAMAVIEMFISLSMLLIFTKIQKRWDYQHSSLPLPQKKLSRNTGGIFILLYFILILSLIIAPLLSVIGNSFLDRSGWVGDNHFSLKWYAQIISRASSGQVSGPSSSQYRAIAGSAITNSLLIALSSALIVVPWATFSAWEIHRTKKNKSFLQSIMVLPMGISSIIIGLGMLKVSTFFHIGQNLFLPVITAHAVIAFPFAFRSLSSTLAGIPDTLIEASRCLGASRIQSVRKILLPLLKRGLITAFVFSFSISMGEINATLMLAPSGTVTLPLAIYRLIGSYNFFGACALGTIMLLICLGAFLIMDKLDSDFL